MQYRRLLMNRASWDEGLDEGRGAPGAGREEGRREGGGLERRAERGSAHDSPTTAAPTRPPLVAVNETRLATWNHFRVAARGEKASGTNSVGLTQVPTTITTTSHAGSPGTASPTAIRMMPMIT